jgi:hypothetical protein
VWAWTERENDGVKAAGVSELKAVIVHTYDLRQEPLGAVYRALVAAAAEVCDGFVLVRRHEATITESALRVIEHLSPWLLEESEASEWPGTELLGHTAVYKFKATAETLAFLAQRVDRLYAWCQPDLPEDLCLLREDGSPWLATIAHEADGFLMLSEAEREDLITRVPALDLN